MKTTRAILWITVISFLASCKTSLDEDNGADANPNNQTFEVSNDAASMSTQLTYLSEPINIRSLTGEGGRINLSATLTLVSEITSPTIEGVPVMATSVAESDQHLVVSYNTAGEEYGGAAVVLTRNGSQLEVSSEVIFPEADINHSIISNNKLLLGGSIASDTAPAWLSSFDLANGQINKNSYVQTELGGFAATSLVGGDQSVFVTTGAGEQSGSGLFQLSINNLSIQSQITLSDSRWLQTLGNRLYVQNGIPGRIEVFEDMNRVNSFAISDADFEAKASFDLMDEFIFAGVGKNGVSVYEVDGAHQGHVELPENTAADFTTNAVAVYGNLIFISNGTTVYVATFSDDEAVLPEIVGELELGDFESVNHVLLQEDYLIVASGTGGVKVIQLETEEEPPISGSILSKENMELIYADSEEPKRNRYAAYVLDDNPNTFWHTEWVSADPVQPHEIWVDLGESYELTEFRYSARQLGNFNGTVKAYELYISDDTSSWGTPFHTGSFVKTRDEQIAIFDAPVTGRYFRFVSLSEINGNPWTSCSEINFVGRSAP